MDEKDKKGGKQEQEQLSKFKIIVTHRNVKEIEDICRSYVNNIKSINEVAAKEQNRSQISFKGPIRIPTKHLRLTVRKSPCGNGTATFDRYEMRIHKRVFYLDCNDSDVKVITKFSPPPGMIVEAIASDAN